MSLQGNTLFPADNPWNQVIAAAPVAANSATLVASIGAGGHLHPDFGTIYEGAYIGIPFNVVSASQPPIEVIVDAYPDESDLVDVPISAGAVIEGDPLPSSQNTGDRHLIVYDKDNNVSYELFNVHRPSETSDGKWHADSEAVWDMSQNSFRTPGFTSADAAGLPILPGLVRPDEVLDAGVINHALRFSVPNSRNQYVYPASHQAGVNNPSYPRMGERFRLKQSFDISTFSPANQVILQALKDYGMIVADNGSGWYLSGEPSPRWDDDDLHELSDILGSSFEAVDLRPIVTGLGPALGPVGTSVTIAGQNFSGAAGQLQVFFGATPAANVSVVSDVSVVATSPAHAPGTVHVTVVTPYGTSATSPADQFTYTSGAAVAGRRVFYNQSKFDGGAAAANASDDGAIATEKSAYLPAGGIAGPANVTSYARGINGLMIDLAGNHGPITAGDFTFKLGANNVPSTWASAPNPVQITVRLGAGAGSSDRIEIIWANGAIANTWLEVIVKGNDAAGGFNTNTGLAASDLFFFGNRVGDTMNDGAALAFATSAADEIAARGASGAGSAVTNLFDFDRNGAVNANDQIIARGNFGYLPRINVASPPAPPELAVSSLAGDEARSAVATALALRRLPDVADRLAYAPAGPLQDSGRRAPADLRSAAPGVMETAHALAIAATPDDVVEFLLAADENLVDGLLADRAAREPARLPRHGPARS